MLEDLYTTKMSSSTKVLQKRFTKIRSKNSNIAKVMTLGISIMLALTLGIATVVMAAVGNEEKNFMVNGKGYSITPVLLENQLATHTESYYVPLRETFEALGYKVYYDVDKTKYQNFIGRYTFPEYDAASYQVSLEDGTPYNREPMRWQKEFVKNDVDKYIYGATSKFNNQMPILEMVKDGQTIACQIGSKKYVPNIPAAAVVLIDGKTYIPLRALAYIANSSITSNDNENSIIWNDDCVKWDDEKHDIYFDGNLTFNEDTLTITINTP